MLNAVSATIDVARTPMKTICRKIWEILKNWPVKGATNTQ
jgi:hypothetical protein